MAGAAVVACLEGERCTLRGLSVGDAPSLAGHADDEAVWRNLFDGFPRPYTLADAQAWCDAARRPATAGFVWGIVVGGEVVGCIGLRPDAGWLRCNAEVGYWIGRVHWGRGIGAEALGRVTAWAWATQPELMRLYAPIFAWNAASQRVAAKAGYALEARLPHSAIKAGRLIDRVQYAAYRPNVGAGVGAGGGEEGAATRIAAADAQGAASGAPDRRTSQGTNDGARDGASDRSSDGVACGAPEAARAGALDRGLAGTGPGCVH